LNFEVHFYVNK